MWGVKSYLGNAQTEGTLRDLEIIKLMKCIQEPVPTILNRETSTMIYFSYIATNIEVNGLSVICQHCIVKKMNIAHPY